MKAKTPYFIFATILFAVFFSSCQKQPVANFTFDKAVYDAGETVILSNASIDAHHCEWLLPGNQTSTDENTNFLIPETASGILSFKLTVFSRNGELTDEVTKSINVNPKKGNAVFWQSESWDIITVSLEGESSQIINKITEEPICGNTDCANFADFPIGTFTYTATDGDFNWTGEITITESACSRVHLLYSNATPSK